MNFYAKISAECIDQILIFCFLSSKQNLVLMQNIMITDI